MSAEHTLGQAMDDPDAPLMTLEVSKPRSVFGMIVTGALGLILIWIAITSPPANPLWTVFLVVIAGLAFLEARAIYRTSTDAIHLTRTRLVSRTGRELCRLDEIKSVERGALAFKPSGGFLLRLKEKRPSARANGLWWRMGRSIGVGGVTRSSEARAMAEMIVALKKDAED